MEQMKAAVGCARHSDMGQVQLTTMFCSMRVARYSLQQGCEGRRGENRSCTTWVMPPWKPTLPSRGCTKPPQTMDKYSKAQRWERLDLKDHNKQRS